MPYREPSPADWIAAGLLLLIAWGALWSLYRLARWFAA